MKTATRYILLALIVLLALASITNIHARTVQLHADAGWQSWVVSGGFAVGFAVFAFLLVGAKGWGARTFYFFCTIFAAALTGVAQTGMYLGIGADWLTALTYGCGAPILEALFAISVHFDESGTHVSPARRGQSSAFDRLINAAASRIERPAQPGGATVAQPQLVPPPVDAQPQPTELRREGLLRILSEIGDPDGINKAQLSKQLGVSRSQIDKDIKRLVADGRLSINGKVEVLG